MGAFSSKAKAGTGPGKGVTELDRAVLSLKTQRKKLTDYQKRTEAAIEREGRAVRQWVKEGNKAAALLALKKRRVQEDALERVNTWILKIEQQLVELETAHRQAAVVESLKVGQAAMAALQKELSLEDVEKLMQDSEDSRAHLQEVQALLDAQLSAEDEEAVLQELNDLEKELGIVDEGKERAAVVVKSKEEQEAEAEARREKEERERKELEDAARELEELEATMPAAPSHTPTVKETQEPEQEEEEEDAGHERERVKESPLPA